MSSRIVVVTTSFPAHDGDPSGHFVQSHARALAAAGDRVHVVAPAGSVTDAPVLRGPLVVHPAGGGALFGFPGALARARERPARLVGAAVFAAGVRRRLRQLAPFDRIVAHWIVPSAWPLCARTAAPLDVVAHGADVRLLVASPAPLRAAIVGALLDRSARLQFVAARLLEALAASLRPGLAERLRASSRVEPAPIEMPDVRAEAARLRASFEGERLAVCMGRLVPDKRVEIAILAAARAGVRLAIGGDGPERSRLEALARASGVRATWTGALPRSEALAWIAAADVLVHPSSREGAPTVVREARALGTRVVACAAGDLARWAETDPGIVITEPDARAIAEAIAAAARERGPP
jgi:teichuronic acid biosynthesis glycosyltransferase TuaC